MTGGRGHHLAPEDYKRAWASEQLELKKRLITTDDFDWGIETTIAHDVNSTTPRKIALNSSAPSPYLAALLSGTKKEQQQQQQQTSNANNNNNNNEAKKPNAQLKLIGGVDISFDKNSPDDACASLVVLSFPELEVLYESYHRVKMTLPYIAGFLAFREADHLVKLVDDLLRNKPELKPQVILVDGNGILHTRGFGLASHFGVLVDIPTIGVAKKFFDVDGLHKDDAKHLNSQLQFGGDYVKIVGKSGQTWGAILQSTDVNTQPVYVSVGHKISLETAVEVVAQCCKYRVPEPVRKADLLSRKWIRDDKKAAAAAPAAAAAAAAAAAKSNNKIQLTKTTTSNNKNNQQQANLVSRS